MGRSKKRIVSAKVRKCKADHRTGFGIVPIRAVA